MDYEAARRYRAAALRAYQQGVISKAAVRDATSIHFEAPEYRTQLRYVEDADGFIHPSGQDYVEVIALDQSTPSYVPAYVTGRPGRPVQPVKVACICRDDVYEHDKGGCRRPGCLCLSPPDLVLWDDAHRGEKQWIGDYTPQPPDRVLK